MSANTQLVHVLSAIDTAASPLPSVEHSTVPAGTSIRRAADRAGEEGANASDGIVMPVFGEMVVALVPVGRTPPLGTTGV